MQAIVEQTDRYDDENQWRKNNKTDTTVYMTEPYALERSPQQQEAIPDQFLI